MIIYLFTLSFMIVIPTVLSDLLAIGFSIYGHKNGGSIGFHLKLFSDEYSDECPDLPGLSHLLMLMSSLGFFLKVTSIGVCYFRFRRARKIHRLLRHWTFRSIYIIYIICIILSINLNFNEKQCLNNIVLQTLIFIFFLNLM